jgi:hypothetical protein
VQAIGSNGNQVIGPATVMMCRRCEDKVILLLLPEIPTPFLKDILGKAAQIEAAEHGANQPDRH